MSQAFHDKQSLWLPEVHMLHLKFEGNSNRAKGQNKKMKRRNYLKSASNLFGTWPSVHGHNLFKNL